MRLSIGLGLLVAAVGVVAGCQNGPRMAGLNPFYKPELTSFQRPHERIESIRLVAKKSTGEDTPEQQALVRDLVTKLATEKDPLIREAALKSIAQFKTPLASQALLAGLGDEHPSVRQASCRLLGETRASNAADALAKIAQADESFDVRVAAARSLGLIGARKEQLLPVLEDPNPAMQLVGVEAMRRSTGQDLGGDVAAYRALARGEAPESIAPREPTAVAGRLPDWVPFF